LEPVNTELEPNRRLSMAEKKLSPSRTYVAMCNKADFSGFYFRKFTIPEEHVGADPGWWFLNRVDFVACLEQVITAEDFQDLKDVSEESPRTLFTDLASSLLSR
jgi:hypothetical protein